MKLITVLCALGCLLLSQSLYAEDASVEYKIKAGYLFNFTKFVTWADDDSETFNLCILGNDPFGELIDPIEQQSVMGRSIKLFRLGALGSKKQPHCHILFVSSSVADMPVAQDVDNTLVVGEGGRFVAQGGMIGFVIKLGKIKLQINLKPIKQSGLKISAKLLEVADVVKGDNNE
jgi:hypothetical protein